MRSYGCLPWVSAKLTMGRLECTAPALRPPPALQAAGPPPDQLHFHHAPRLSPPSRQPRRLRDHPPGPDGLRRVSRSSLRRAALVRDGSLARVQGLPVRARRARRTRREPGAARAALARLTFPAATSAGLYLHSARACD